ncbi:MAG: ABC transporter permease [Chloroflexi bacterium]|nr:ABC transporter permease [Chloroflexota bacterium]
MIQRLRDQLLIPALAVVMGLFVGAIVMIVTSPLIDGQFQLDLPLKAYGALIDGSVGSFNAIIQTLVEATPLVLAGLAVGLGFKAGLFNIGAQGQFLLGALGAALVGGWLAGASPWVAIPLALLAGVIAGAIYGFIPGALKAFTGAHEVVTTIMLNYIALYILAYLITGPLRDPFATFARTVDVGNAALPLLPETRNGHIGILLAAAAVPIVWWLLFRSTLGFQIRAVGANPDAARYAGMRPRALIILTMSVSGLLAGLAGAIQILGLTKHMPIGYASSIGFDAIAVALLGRSHPLGVLLAALLFGAMRAGSGLMQVRAGIPVQMIDVLQGVILFFLAADVILRWVFRVRARGTGIGQESTVTRSYGGQTSI